MKHYVIGPFPPLHPSLKCNFYGLYRRRAEDYAHSIGRELAEGPTEFITGNHYGPVEFWPLVIEEGEDYSISG